MNYYDLADSIFIPDLKFDTAKDKEAAINFFPDFYHSTLQKSVSKSFFDYTTCLIHSATNQYDENDSEKLRRNILSEFKNVEDQKKIEWILRSTSYAHELRHFHDLIGTSAGLFRLQIVLEDIVDFYSTIIFKRLESKNKYIGIPGGLIRSFLNGELNFLDDYIKQHHQRTQTLSLFDGSFPPYITKPFYGKESFTGFFTNHGGNHADLQKTKFPMSDYNGTDDLLSKISFVPSIPLNIGPNETYHLGVGYRAMTESNAWQTQYEFIRSFFGHEYAEEIKEKFQKVNPYKNPYMVLDLYCSKYHKPFWMSYLSHEIERTLNQKYLNTNNLFSLPSWDFIGRISTDKLKAETKNQEYLSYKYESEISAFRFQIDLFKKYIDSVNDLAEGLKSRILKTIYEVMSDIIHRSEIILDHKTRKPDLLANSSTYLNNFFNLPLPAIRAVPSDTGEFKMLTIKYDSDMADFNSWNNWLFLVNTVAQCLLMEKRRCFVKDQQFECSDKHQSCESDFTKNCALTRFMQFI
jgi:hypothetical protein